MTVFDDCSQTDLSSPSLRRVLVPKFNSALVIGLGANTVCRDRETQSQCCTISVSQSLP